MQYRRHFLFLACCFATLLAHAETAAEADATSPPPASVAAESATGPAAESAAEPATAPATNPANPAADAATNRAAADSLKLEKSLQSLNWPQFRSVVEAVPKLKADVDAYGELGWQYVQMNYKNYRWRKSINRLSDEQRQQLAALIQDARHKQ
jgi:pyruvate/2-oxoglutarate dehydrogenase complex dihydrolipoamide acyltransferase (E2) component